MLVQEVMTAPVVSVGPATSIGDAARLMLLRRISGLPVVHTDGKILGIVSEGDFLRRKELGTEVKRSRWLEFLVGPGKAADEYTHTRGRKVEEIMSHNVVTVEPTTPLRSVIESMAKHRVKRLPVVVEGKVVGIVARSDILQALATALHAQNDQPLTDADIEAAVNAELASQGWSRNGFIKVGVKDGVVELSGCIFDERERVAARVAAENVPGVKSVLDQLTWIEPISGMMVLPYEINRKDTTLI